MVAKVALFFAASPASAQAPPRAAAEELLLQRMLVAEDARGRGAEGIEPLLQALRSESPTLRRVAVRALGRLQDPTQFSALAPALDDPMPTIRTEAANALAQSVQSVTRQVGTAAGTDARNAVQAVQSTLIDRLRREPDLAVVGVLARSLGRLPVGDSASARQIERAIGEKLAAPGGKPESLANLPAAAAHDVTEGLYALARGRRALGSPSSTAIVLLRAASRYGSDARVRRIGLLGLTAAGALDSAAVRVAARDGDPQVRRLALAGVNTLASAVRATVVTRALGDTSAMVRVDAVHAARVGSNVPDCGPIRSALGDSDPHVMLAAIDALGGPCADSTARTKILSSFVSLPRWRGHSKWQGEAHALVALAHADSAAAAAALRGFLQQPANRPSFVPSSFPHYGEYAARAATQLKDASALMRLAADNDYNVRDAAIAGLSKVRKHDADSVYVAALESRGYQVVLVACTALEGSKSAAAVPALLGALDRLSAERRENSHDPRMAILTRLGELGSAKNAARLEPYLADFDTTIAARAAYVLTTWTGVKAVARAMPLPIRPEPLAEIFAARGLQLRITMDTASGGGTIVVRLFPDEAPATVARMVRLARAHYFDGLTFHRIATNFVLQGGSPGATEYVGDGPFMRDEVGLRSHDRGTLGISTRGRDTGDAQLFINTVDNPRLDHDYTVFGVIISGMPIVDKIIEGDVMARVEVLGRR